MKLRLGHFLHPLVTSIELAGVMLSYRHSPSLGFTYSGHNDLATLYSI